MIIATINTSSDDITVHAAAFIRFCCDGGSDSGGRDQKRQRSSSAGERCSDLASATAHVVRRLCPVSPCCWSMLVEPRKLP